LPTEDETHDILYEQVEAAVKRLKKGKSPVINDRSEAMIQTRGEKVT
jgi:hypothetical protein